MERDLIYPVDPLPAEFLAAADAKWCEDDDGYETDSGAQTEIATLVMRAICDATGQDFYDEEVHGDDSPFTFRDLLKMGFTVVKYLTHFDVLRPSDYDYEIHNPGPNGTTEIRRVN